MTASPSGRALGSWGRPDGSSSQELTVNHKERNRLAGEKFPSANNFSADRSSMLVVGGTTGSDGRTEHLPNDLGECARVVPVRFVARLP